jgi:hypothetical protein
MEIRTTDFATLETSPSGLDSQLKNLNSRLAKTGKQFIVEQVIPRNNGNLLVIGSTKDLTYRPPIAPAPEPIFIFPPNLSTPPPLDPVSTCTINIGEILISHVNGTDTIKQGLTGNTSNATPYISIVNSNLVLLPNSNEFRSEDRYRKLVRFRCYTNILPENLPLLTGDPMAPAQYVNKVNVGLIKYWRTSPTTTTNNQILGGRFDRVSTQLNVGQNITGSPYPFGMFMDMEIANWGNSADPYNWSLGLGGAYGRFYYNFKIVIGANLPTGDYKLLFKLDYQNA